MKEIERSSEGISKAFDTLGARTALQIGRYTCHRAALETDCRKLVTSRNGGAPNRRLYYYGRHSSNTV